MCVTLSSKTLPIRSGPMAEAAGTSRPLSLSGRISTTGIIPRDPGPRGEHGARGAEEEYIDPEPRPNAEAPTLTLENLERLEGRDSLAAVLASVVARSDKSSLPPSVTGPDPAHARLVMTKVKEWRGKGKGKEMAGTITTLSAALKTKLGLSALKKPPPSMSPGVELLTRDVKSCRGIRGSPMDTCPSPFHPRVRIVPVCDVGDTCEAEMKSYGLAALAPLAITHPSPHIC